MDEQEEIEMRVAGAGEPGRAAEIERAVRTLDGEATIRLDPATGIVHVRTRRDTLEIVEALSRAGLEATAMTG